MTLKTLAVVVVVLSACGAQTTPQPGGKVVSVQENSNPTGFIGGRILDSSDGKPVAGAIISTVDGSISTNTDASGLYKLGPMPLGVHTVFYEGAGYLRRAFSVQLVSTGGMFPVGNTTVTQDVDLARPSATIEGQVLTSTGLIAKGATLYLDLRQQGYEVVETTKADDNGKFRFAGMPGTAFGEFVQVNVAPYDENGDGVPDYNATGRSYTLFPGFTTYNTLTLFALGVQLVTSNISDTDLLANESITMTFSGAVRTNQSTITLFRSSGSVQVGASLSWDASNTNATLTPVGGPLVEGQVYVAQYVIRAVNGAQTSSSISFTVRPPGGAPPLGSVQNFRLVTPASPDSATLSVGLAWDPVQNAGGYRIYGKDAAMGSAYLLLTTVSSGLTTGANANINLFDAISGDAFVTPLGYKNKITLAIVSTDRLFNETSFMTAGTIELKDVLPPTVQFGSSSGSANNLTGTAAATVALSITWSEVMSTDTLPQIILPNAATSAVWLWSGPKSGTFTITVPAGIDGRGAVSVTGGKDTCDLLQVTPWDGSLQ